MAISPYGRLYAIKLSDNSVVILSAMEMEQIATITGLQLPRLAHKMKDTVSKCNQGPSHMIPALLHPQRPDNLLIAIPARQSFYEQSHSLGSLSVLQTFNLHTGSHISRQALARTNITVLNKGPDGAAIVSPDLQYLDMSRDGKWLATVDAWSPHRVDVDALESFPLRSANDNRGWSEVFLKFWAWNDMTEVWELVTRIDEPHFRTVDGPVPLYCLASRPDRHGFTTVGADGILRFWEPSARHHSSTKSRTHRDRLEQTWKCKATIDLTARTEFEHGKSLASASMSFSEDGSVLAICIQGVVHLIDTHRWEIRHTRSGLFLNGAFSIRFLGRHVVIASRRSTAIWDTVNDVLKNIVNPRSASTSSSGVSDAILLAVSPKTQSFAIVTRCSSPCDSDKSTKRYRRLSHHVEVYNPHSSSPLFQSALEYPPLCLLSDPRTGDYVIVDTATNLKRLSCHHENMHPGSASGDMSSHLKAGLDNLFGGLGQTLSKPKLLPLEEEATVSQSRKPGGIFDHAPPFSLPPVSILFKDVINSLVTAS
jgi:NET1-associated nuclear protein 1 (U3 small nucleolar RNA-associated protein 17)